MKKRIQHAGTLLCILALVSCGNADDKTAEETKDSVTTTIPPSVPENVTVSLFDGKTLAGWHAYNKPGEVKNWKVEDGAMVCQGAAKDAHGGDIVTDKEYANFELSWEWKVDKGSNSGVMYHVIEDTAYDAPYKTGPEYQVIDDIGFPEKLQDWQKAGADYAMTAANEKKVLKPVGEWNSSKIVYNNGHIEHWLNDQLIVESDRNSEDWKTKRSTGKWKDYPHYASVSKGKIALQDHGQKAYFRNITIKEL
jgi:hypothetical protein